MIYINPTMSVIIVTINELNTPSKGLWLSDWIKQQQQYCA